MAEAGRLAENLIASVAKYRKAMAEKKKKVAPEAHPDTEKLKQVEEQLAKAQAEIDAKKNDYLRLMAEFDTFRRRTAEEKLSLVSSASAETIKGLLPILDDCEIALSQLEKSTDSDAAKEGTLLIFNKLMSYLKTKGLERIEAKDQSFDTEFHEAVTTFPAADESQKGKVIDVVQTGYTLGGKVLRYAKVIVGA